MGKKIKCIIIYLLIGLGAYGIFRLSDKYQLNILKSNIECTIITRGCTKGNALAVNNKAIYIAEKNRIKEINKEGKEKVVYSGTEAIEDMVIKEDVIYILSGKKLIKFNIKNNQEEEILLSNIALGGNDINRKLLLNNNKLLISISALTNSGIFQNGAYEYTLKENNNGINNGCIYEFNIDNYDLEVFASGIRGVTGMDCNNKGEVFAIFSGMKNEGNRPINRDKDYIYKIEKGKWYGFPDFSGGDYINSPRFAGDELVTPIIENPITKVIDKPLFVDSFLDNLKELGIDKDGILLPENSMIYWDQEKKAIMGFIDNTYNLEVLRVTDKSNIKDIIYTGEEFLLLDSGVGCVFRLHNKNGIKGFELPIRIWIYLIILVASTIVVFIIKYKKNNLK